MYDPNDVFVLGAVKVKGVRSAAWSSSKIPNLAEYRLVVLETVSLCKLIEDNLRWDKHQLQIPGGSLPGHVPRDEAAGQRLEQLSGRLKTVREQLVKLLGSGGDVVAIWDDRFFFRFTSVSPLGWSPYKIAYKPEQGERVDVEDERFTRYFAEVRRWHRLLDFSNKDWASLMVYHVGTKAEFSASTVAKTKYGAPIAATVSVTWGLNTSGHMTLLPPPTECDVQQAVAIILSDYAGIEYDLPDPQWLHAVSVPMVDKIDAARGRNQARMTRLQAAQARLDAAAARYTAPRRILFLPGMRLQQACAEVCGTIFGPVDDSIDDFVIPAQPDEILVEVKGFDGSARLGELAKVNTHIQRYEQERERTPKVMILVSQYREQPLGERPEDTQYPSNVLTWAERRNYALVSVQELFKAYCAWRSGTVSREALIERMLSGVGPTQLVMTDEEWEPSPGTTQVPSS